MSIEKKVIAGDVRMILYPAQIDDSDNSGFVDCQELGTLFVATQIVGAVTGTSPYLDGKIQESNDGLNFTDVEGAYFTRVFNSNHVESLVIEPTKRYLRHTRTIAGMSPTAVLGAHLLPVTEQLPSRVVTIDLPEGMLATIS